MVLLFSASLIGAGTGFTSFLPALSCFGSFRGGGEKGGGEGEEVEEDLTDTCLFRGFSRLLLLRDLRTLWGGIELVHDLCGFPWLFWVIGEGEGGEGVTLGEGDGEGDREDSEEEGELARCLCAFLETTGDVITLDLCTLGEEELDILADDAESHSRDEEDSVTPCVTFDLPRRLGERLVEREGSVPEETEYSSLL